MEFSIDQSLLYLFQTAFYVVSPLVTLLAVSVAYIALVKQSRPQILIQYRPNPDIQTMIDLVIENLGNGLARDVKFSKPLPVKYFGIEKSDGSGKDILSDGLPAIAVGQRFVFDGGQFGGLTEKIEEPLEILVTYSYKNPIGIKRKRKEICVLDISHIKHMPTRYSAEQAIVEALMGSNTTTLQSIQKELANIGAKIGEIIKTQDKIPSNQ